MEFRELGEKEYVIVSVGSWAVSYSGGFSVGVGWRGGAGSAHVRTTASKAEGGNGVDMRTSSGLSYL